MDKAKIKKFKLQIPDLCSKTKRGSGPISSIMVRIKKKINGINPIK